MNAVQRLHMQYGNRGIIWFYNRPQGGAGVKMHIPVQEEEKGADTDEYSDS